MNLNQTLLKYSLIMLVPNLFSSIQYFIQIFFQIQMIKNLHNQMMIYSTHGDLLNFFDKIPIARLLNRFSNDISNIEDEFIWTLNNFILMFTMFVFSIFVALYNLSISLSLLFILYFIFCVYFQNLYISINKDIYRLDNVTKTPIVNLTKEIVEGKLVI